MTTSTDVLAYLSNTFPHTGRMQRLKLLYYAQAWHATWFGHPLFEDPVKAWEMGPVPAEAWRADRCGTIFTPGRTPLDQDQMAVVASIWQFYGHMSGSALSDLTHREGPWVKHYLEADPLVRGQKTIPVVDMIQFYGAALASGQPTPMRPHVMATPVESDSFDDIVAHELDRWSETLALLADR